MTLVKLTTEEVAYKYKISINSANAILENPELSKFIDAAERITEDCKSFVSAIESTSEAFVRASTAKLGLAEIQREIHKTSVAKGWWEKERNFGEMLMLAVTEISEAMEAWREGRAAVYEENGKPEGTAVELADAIIRLLDTLESMGVDAESVILQKMAYNKTRPYRHGGKKA